jgi:hypothetical protein
VLVTATDPPVTIPDNEPTLAIAGLLLLQVPPPVASVNVVVSPEHTINTPDIGAGSASTVTTAVMIHPVGNV